ncbi:hypothetical protein HDU76_001406, partial [Blyttiomyces sp. JEL0837]
PCCDDEDEEDDCLLLLLAFRPPIVFLSTPPESVSTACALLERVDMEVTAIFGGSAAKGVGELDRCKPVISLPLPAPSRAKAAAASSSADEPASETESRCELVDDDVDIAEDVESYFNDGGVCSGVGAKTKAGACANNGGIGINGIDIGREKGGEGDDDRSVMPASDDRVIIIMLDVMGVVIGVVVGVYKGFSSCENRSNDRMPDGEGSMSDS